MVDPVVAWIARASLAALFALSALHKARDLHAFGVVLLGYRIVPQILVGGVARLVMAAEATLSLGLLLPGAAGRAATGGAWLLLVYSAAIGLNLLRGRRFIDCGCLGPAGRQPLSAWLLARNTVLIGAALLAAWPIRGRPMVWIDALSVAGGVLASALLFYTANALATHSAVLAQSTGRSP